MEDVELNKYFEFHVECWEFEQVRHWIQQLAKGDCSKCLLGMPYYREHEGSGIAGADFDRYHLLIYYMEAI